MALTRNSALLGLLIFITPFTLVSSSFVVPTLHNDPLNHASNLGDFKARSIVQTRAANFSWESLPASEKLVWQDCFTDRQCARLSVPLNYSDPDGEKAIIAITRIPSPLPANSSEYRGPILFNPGGPGGSGVNFIADFGKKLSAIVGPQFDIVGFDPRGLGRSLPRVNFFKTDAERAIWEAGAIYTIDPSPEGVARAWAQFKIQGRLAGERQSDVLGHFNTDQTARDMLRITEAHGREKLQYWGFSYGSVLGATFAAMFPDKVERMIIDGVVDAEDYYATLWSKNLLDTNKTMQAFFDGCATAGPDGCAFHAPTPDDISRNLTNLYTAIRNKPVPVHINESYGLVDYNHLHAAVFASLYSPVALFPLLARGLADLAAGDGTLVFLTTRTPAFQCSCGEGPESDVVPEEDVYVRAAISCNDGAEVPDSLEDYQKYFAQLNSSSTFADTWGVLRGECIGWPKLPKNHFRGPFVGNTSFPLLLIGNTADPVTPLSAAKKMAEGYTGSVVLTQDSPGHSSLAAASLCTQKYVRGYFINGTLPDAGTVCDVDVKPFANSTLKARSQSDFENNLTAEEQDILDAIKSISSSTRLPRLL